MKRLLSAILLVFVIASALSLSAFAKTVAFEKDYVKENDVVFAGINGIRPFLGDLQNPSPLEDALYWLSDYANSYNIKFVSFNGRMSSGSNYGYTEYCKNEGHTQAELSAACAADTEALKEFHALKNMCKVLGDVELPYGISIHRDDYFAAGFFRANLVANEFTVDEFIGGSVNFKVDSYDTNSFAIVVENGEEKYIVYQLEAFPRLEVINWFNATNAANPDKRAFIFTTSFADKNGDMFTQYDPTVYTYITAPVKGNTTLITNMVNSGKPYDGESIWKYAIANHDNIVMIMSANASVGKRIVTNTFKNNNGYDVLSVVTNLIGGYDSEGAYPVLAKFSEDTHTIDLRYAVPYANKVGGYVSESKIEIPLNLADLPDPDPLTLLPKIKTQVNGDNTAYINGYAGNVFKPQANMTKAEASIIFARLLEGSQTIPSGNTTRFTDVKEGDWFYDAIAYLDTLGFYYTNTSDKYNPNTPITRAEFVELAYFASEIEGDAGVKFKDVPTDHKYYDAIIAAAASGLVNGYEDKTFRPDATITRAEVVTIINRLLSLVADKDTVVKSTLTNVFSDISGHWAEYQVLMASNSKVKSESFLNINKDVLKETATAIYFENKHVKVSINKKDGKVSEVIYLPTGENVLQITTTPWFTYANSTSGALLESKSAAVVDGRLKITYKGGATAYFIVEVFDNYFTVALDSNIPKSISKLTFGNLDFNYTYARKDGTFRASGIVMDTRVNPLAIPGGTNSLVGGYTRTDLGVNTIGSKLGIVFSLYEQHREYLKELVSAIDPEKGVTSDRGGPFTPECPELYEDYALISSIGISEGTLDNIMYSLRRYDVNQIDMHTAGNFTNGDFNFTNLRDYDGASENTFYDAKTFKERIVDKLHAEGFKIGLHTYSSQVSRGSIPILSDPKWQKQLQYYEKTYTLRSKLTKFTKNIKTEEDATKFFDEPYSSSYVLIDNEIIKIGKGTTSGFINITRGQFGTEVAEHEAGAEVRHLQVVYSHFQPIPGSELFYQVGKNLAKAYNEGDFDMIYLDALESFMHFAAPEKRYYYYAEFYRTVVANCIKKPIIEDSASVTCAWPARGRGGAVDMCTKASVRRTLDVKRGHEDMIDRYFTSTIGWFNFCPDRSAQYMNTMEKTLFRSDFDTIGALAIAHDYSNVDNQFGAFVSNPNPSTRHPDNMLYYSVFTRLRKGGYFAPEVKQALIDGKYNFHLFKQADGTYAFREVTYLYNRIYNMPTGGYISATAENPYDAHTPFIRIEQRYSTLSENEKLFYAIDDSLEVSKVAVKNKKIAAVDLSKRLVFKVKVFGNGSKTGGILISITSTGADGHTDYYLPTAHNGWQEFILVDHDNGDHPGSNFDTIDYGGHAYSTYQNNPSRSKIDTISILLHGDVSGVKMDDIMAYAIADAPAKNPSITINGQTITFNTEIHSGEFIEYYPEYNKAYLGYYTANYDGESFGDYDADTEADTKKFISNSAHTKEIPFTGMVTVPKGSFTYSYNAEAMTAAPLRAEVNLALQGKVIKNPEGWVAPEIDMKESTLDVIIK